MTTILHVTTQGTDDPSVEVLIQAGTQQLKLKDGDRIAVGSTWTDEQGNYHASLIVEPAPEPENVEGQQINQSESSRHMAENPNVMSAHDDITNAEDDYDTALKMTPDMEEAKSDMEESFADAKSGVNPEDAQTPQFEKKNDPEAYISEGLRPKRGPGTAA
jgi:translation initiation factor IF-2